MRSRSGRAARPDRTMASIVREAHVLACAPAMLREVPLPPDEDAGQEWSSLVWGSPALLDGEAELLCAPMSEQEDEAGWSEVFEAPDIDPGPAPVPVLCNEIAVLELDQAKLRQRLQVLQAQHASAMREHARVKAEHAKEKALLCNELRVLAEYAFASQPSASPSRAATRYQSRPQCPSNKPDSEELGGRRQAQGTLRAGGARLYVTTSPPAGGFCDTFVCFQMWSCVRTLSPC